MNLKIPVFFRSHSIALCIFLCLAYWSYLFFTTDMVIKQDAIGYEMLGNIFLQQGWTGYLKNGPAREPLYPFLVSVSMRMARQWSLPYQSLQTLLQLLILLMTQVMAIRILSRCQVRKSLIALTVLYLGFSPALLNSALSLYSEIATYPLVMGLVLLGSHAMVSCERNSYIRNLLAFIGLALTFLSLIMIKGIYELIALFFVTPFVVLLCSGLLSRDRVRALNSLACLMVFLSIVFGATTAYRSLNLKYNGHYTLTDSRGPYSLYSSAARRTDKMPPRRLLAGLAFTAGEGACVALMGEEECRFWGIKHYDTYGIFRLKRLSRDLPPDQVDAKLVSLAKDKIKKKPLRFFLLMGLEMVRMHFWESTQIGFVDYPEWLMRFYGWGPFKNSLRFLVSFLCLGGTLFMGFWSACHFKEIFSSSREENRTRDSTVYFIFLVILGHVGFYSLFMTNPRFTFPVAPLMVMSVAIACHFRRQKTSA